MREESGVSVTVGPSSKCFLDDGAVVVAEFADLVDECLFDFGGGIFGRRECG